MVSALIHSLKNLLKAYYMSGIVLGIRGDVRRRKQINK